MSTGIWFYACILIYNVCGEVVSTPSYESEGLGSDPSLDSQCVAHLSYSFFLSNKWLPRETWGR